MGENVLSIRTAQHCFNRFNNGNLELDDLPRASRSLELDVELIWWGVNGITHWEILSSGSTMTAGVYCHQLDRITKKLKVKQGRIYYLHDNARPHVPKSVCEKLLKLGWISVPHPPYSPDLSPTDYHLFRSLS